MHLPRRRGASCYPIASRIPSASSSFVVRTVAWMRLFRPADHVEDWGCCSYYEQMCAAIPALLGLVGGDGGRGSGLQECQFWPLRLPFRPGEQRIQRHRAVSIQVRKSALTLLKVSPAAYSTVRSAHSLKDRISIWNTNTDANTP